MATKPRQDLGYLGEDFQKRLIHAFMEDAEFFRDLTDIVDQNMFTNAMYRIYVAYMKDWFDKYGVKISYATMVSYINERTRSDIDREQLTAFNLELQQMSLEGIDWVRETATKFFKQQNIVKIANEILKVAGTGEEDKYDACAELLNKAVSVGMKEDMGENVFDNIEETLSDDYRVAIPTGIQALDEALQGGIGKGELGVIIAPSGVGKTSLTTAMASSAATHACPQNNNQGFKVLQIVFEDRIKQIQRKHIGKITQVESKDLSKPEFIETVKARLDSYEQKEMLKNNLRLVRFPSGEITASYIERYIKKLINVGFTPDLVVIDYFECLAHERSTSKDANEFNEEGRTMRKFEAIAGKLNIAFWIPSQGTKDSIAMEMITMDKIGGSVKKAQIAHIIISIAKSIDDAAKNMATFALLKNRAGQSGAVWENCYFNNGTCTINTATAEQRDTQFDYNAASQEKTMKKVLKNAFGKS